MICLRRRIAVLAAALVFVFGGAVIASCEEQNHGWHYPAGE